MDGKTAKMQKQVAKLLRHAEDVVGTPEEAVFMAKAFELIAKYGLDMASIEADKQGLDTSDMPDAIKWSARIDGKYTAQQVSNPAHRLPLRNCLAAQIGHHLHRPHLQLVWIPPR
ncbi:hypothetical protein SEA_PHRANNY_76 [Mycobacterium phage Phranny]|nr:hypothetical protein SEA_PHRANNY_76 [Mycobacterium phage Phranny]